MSIEIPYKEIATKLDDAALQKMAVDQISLSYPISVEDAYEIQAISIHRRMKRGHKFVGIKLGFTSKAKMIQMGVDELIWGRLTQDMEILEGGSVPASNYIHPRVEPEIAFLTKKKIDRPINLLEAGAYIEAVCGAIELIDSRYSNFKFSLPDVIADNCSSSGYVLGSWHAPKTDLSNVGIVMQVNGKNAALGSSAAILGHPLRSFVKASHLLVANGIDLPEGSLILAGAATEAQAVSGGDRISARFQGLGRVEFELQ